MIELPILKVSFAANENKKTAEKTWENNANIHDVIRVIMESHMKNYRAPPMTSDHEF